MKLLTKIYSYSIQELTAEREYLKNNFDLNGVIISNGYYGSFCQSGPSQKMQSQIDRKATVLKTKRAFAPAKYINLRIFSLGVLFIGGITVGCYLLYRQCECYVFLIFSSNSENTLIMNNFILSFVFFFAAITWPIKLVFDLVSHEEWESDYLPTGRRLFSQNVRYILLQHTSTKNCANLTDCKMFLRDYQVCYFQRIFLILSYSVERNQKLL